MPLLEYNTSRGALLCLVIEIKKMVSFLLRPLLSHQEFHLYTLFLQESIHKMTEYNKKMSKMEQNLECIEIEERFY